MVSVRRYVGSLKGYLGGAGGCCSRNYAFGSFGYWSSGEGCQPRGWIPQGIFDVETQASCLALVGIVGFPRQLDAAPKASAPLPPFVMPRHMRELLAMNRMEDADAPCIVGNCLCEPIARAGARIGSATGRSWIRGAPRGPGC